MGFHMLLGPISVAPAASGGPQPPNSFSYTIPPGVVASDLTNFPIPVFLETLPQSFWAATNAGQDIRVHVGPVELPTDLVFCDTTNKRGVLWVKLPSIAAATSTTFVLSIDGTSARPVHGDPNGRHAVWSDYLVVVIPSSEGVVDRTGTHANGAVVGGSVNDGPSIANNPVSRTNLLGGGYIDLDGVNDYAQMGITDMISTAGIFTVGISLMQSSDNGQNRTILRWVESAGSDQVLLMLENSDHFGVWDNANAWLDTQPIQYPGVDIVSRLNVAYDTPAERKIVVNGVTEFKGVDPALGDISDRGQDQLLFGVRQDLSSTLLSGYIGFTYIRSEYLTDDWISAEYHFMADVYSAFPASSEQIDIGTNVDFETGDGTGWVLDGCSVVSNAPNIPSAAFGTFFIFPPVGASFDPYNDIDVSSYASEIDANECGLRAEWAFGSNAFDADTARLIVEFYDNTMTLISSVKPPSDNNNAAGEWVAHKLGQPIPANTRTIRLQIQLRRSTGSNLDAGLDINYVKLVRPIA